MKRFSLSFLLFSVLLAAHGSSPAQEQPAFRVIVHPQSPVSSLSRTEVSKMLFKRTSKWSDGDRVEPVDQIKDAAVREAFSQAVHRRSVANVQSFWQRQIFSGRGVPPPELAGDAAVVDFIKTHPGGIGYVSAQASLDGVKAITVTE